jgi:hypothetical protein
LPAFANKKRFYEPVRTANCVARNEQQKERRRARRNPPESKLTNPSEECGSRSCLPKEYKMNKSKFAKNSLEAQCNSLVADNQLYIGINPRRKTVPQAGHFALDDSWNCANLSLALIQIG